MAAVALSRRSVSAVQCYSYRDSRGNLRETLMEDATFTKSRFSPSVQPLRRSLALCSNADARAG